MDKRLIFRILGALASALIIVSVFVPFVSVTGYTSSLWETYKLSGAIYLPIMIIVFGAIGVIFFSLNIKTEFAYMSTGAIAFFAVMETIDIVNQGVFNTLSIGYYFLVIGALLTGIMAFLLNMKVKKVKDQVPNSNSNEKQETVLDQIDKLYNDQTTIAAEPIRPIDNVVEPIQPINTISVEPVQPIVDSAMKPIEEPQVINPVLDEQIPQQPINSLPAEPQSSVNPVVQEFKTEPQINNQPLANNEQSSQFNPVVQEFTNIAPEPISPVVEQFNQPQATPEQITNITESNIPVQPTQSNPVVEQFTNTSSSAINQNTNTGQTDIFGQPINK